MALIITLCILLYSNFTIVKRVIFYLGHVRLSLALWHFACYRLKWVVWKLIFNLYNTFLPFCFDLDRGVDRNWWYNVLLFKLRWQFLQWFHFFFLNSNHREFFVNLRLLLMNNFSNHNFFLRRQIFYRLWDFQPDLLVKLFLRMFHLLSH